MGALCWSYSFWYLTGSRASARQSYWQHLKTTISTKQSMSRGKGFRKLDRKKKKKHTSSFLNSLCGFQSHECRWAVFPLSRLVDVLGGLLPTETMLFLITLHSCLYHQMSVFTSSRQFHGSELTLINIIGIFFSVYRCSYDLSGQPLGTSGHYSPSVTKW